MSITSIEEGTIQFVDALPPKKATGFGGRPRAAWLDVLQGNPGKWAILPIKGKSVQGATKRWKQEGFEFAARGDVAYGRFVGEPHDEVADEQDPIDFPDGPDLDQFDDIPSEPDPEA